MLSVFVGNDREKIKKHVDAIRKAHAGAPVFEYDSGSFNKDEVRGYLEQNDLFGEPPLIIFRKVWENESASEFIISHTEEIVSSVAECILIEEIIPKNAEKTFKKFTDVVQCVSKESGGTVIKPFNVFTLTDALASRDKKRTWVLYQKALASGMSPEEIHPLFLWQIKALLSTKQSKTAEEAGLKPFVFSKSKKFSDRSSLKEWQALLRKCLSVHIDARRGKRDFGIATEEFILSL